MNETIQLTIKAILDESNFKSRVKGLLDGIKPPKDILGVKENAAKLKSALNELKLPDNIASKFSGQFGNLESEIERYQSLLAKPVKSKADISKIQESGNKINQILNEITRDIMEINSKKISPNIDTSKIKNLESEAEKLKTEINSINNEFLKSTKKLYGKDLSGSDIIGKLTQGVARSKKNKPLVEEMKKALNVGDYEEAIKIVEKLKSVKLKGLYGSENSAFGDGEAGAKRYQAALKELISLFQKLQSEEQKGGKGTGLKDKVQTYKEIENALNTLYQKGNLQADEELKQMGAAAQTTANQVKNLNQEYSRVAESNYSKGRQVADLKNQVQYFFGLQNQVYLFRRAIRDTIDTVKELDASMTETAVVTDFSVSDMWAQLPEYTAAANELGSTINDVYQANTLYFQQGLDSEQAMGLGIETLKMARIAGMDAAQATDLMTAALRGFNMELNQTSAQRVNDVYSKLAAVTASDTQEIGTAVSKTASLASNAGMDLEETSALLAQVVETTREAPETAGTALKTIIARFGEVKELFSQGQLLGQDEEGQEIQVNRVDKALQSAGINLKEFVAGNKGLGEIFIELSKRWKGLSTAQQRYIATQSAGARQQSRFIAMLQDTERLQYLLDEAYNSNGASAIQFEKTQESVEAKTNKLKNAWDEFTMGLMNEKALKGIIDFGKNALSIINDLIEGISNGIKNIFGEGISDVTKGILTFGTAFTALGLGGKGANALLGGLGGMITPGESIMKGFKGGLFGSKENAIIGELQELNANVAAIRYQENQKIVQDKQLNLQQFKKAQTDLRSEEVIKKTPVVNKSGVGTYQKQTFKIADINSKIKEIPAPYQSLLLRNQPGFLRNMQNDFNAAFEKINPSLAQAGLKRKVEKSIKQEFKSGSIDFEQYTRSLFDPKQIENKFGPEIASKMRSGMIKEWMKNTSLNERLLQIEEKRKANPELDAKGAVDEILYEQNINKERELTRTEKIANSFSKVGNAATNAGMAVNQFGLSLQSMGFEKAGAAAQQFGNIIMGLGPAISSIGQIPDLIKVHPVAAVFTGIATAIGATVFAVKKHQENLRKEAEEIQKNYEKISKSVTDNLSKINSIKLNFGELAKGVDEYGNNLTLNDTQYKEYQESVEKLTKISPSLIKGYNAEGKAIIDKTNAIKQATKAQEESLKLAQEEYVTPTAMSSMIAGIRQEKKFKKHVTRVDANATTGEQMRGFGGKDSTSGKFLTTEIDDLRNALDAADFEIKNHQSKLINDLAGHEINLYKPSLKDLQFLSEHKEDINNKLKESLLEQGKILDSEQQKNIDKSLDSLTKGYNEIKNEVQPLMQQTYQYLSKEGYDIVSGAIGENFSIAFNKGVEDLSFKAITEQWTGDELQKSALDFGRRLSVASGEGSQYAKIMDKISEKQKDFENYVGNIGAEQKYRNSVQNLSNELRGLAISMNDGSEAGQALAESFSYQADQVDSYASEMQFSISSALDTMADNFESARKVFDDFSNSLEGGDYYTAAEGFNKIFEDIMDGLDNKGFGSETFWKGAQEYVDDSLYASRNLEKVQKKIKQIHTWFEEGEAGTNNFAADLREATNDKNFAKRLKEKGFNVGDIIQTDKNGNLNLKITEDGALEALAYAWQSSEKALTAAIDKNRQYVTTETGNFKQLRAAIIQDERSLKAPGSTTKEGRVYYKKDLFTSEAEEVYKGDRKKVNKAIQKAEARGIELIDLKTLKGNQFKNFIQDAGIGRTNTLEESISKLIKMGFTDNDELKSFLSKDSLYGDKITKNGKFEAALKTAQDYQSADPVVSDIKSDTAGILSGVNALLVKEGKLPSELEKQYQENFSSKDAKQDVDNFKNAEGDVAKAAAYKKLLEDQSKVTAEIERLEEGKEEATPADQKKFQAQIDFLKRYQDTIIAGISEFEANKNKVYTDIAALSQKVKTQDGKEVEGVAEKDQGILRENTYDFYSALHTDNIQEGAERLLALTGKFNLEKESVAALGEEFVKLNKVNLGELSKKELTSLLSSLGLSDSRVKALINSLHQLNNQKLKEVNGQIKKAFGEKNLDSLGKKVGKNSSEKKELSAQAYAARYVAKGGSQDKAKGYLEKYGISGKKAEATIELGVKISKSGEKTRNKFFKETDKLIKKNNKKKAVIDISTKNKKAKKELNELDKKAKKVTTPKPLEVITNPNKAIKDLTQIEKKAKEAGKPRNPIITFAESGLSAISETVNSITGNHSSSFSFDFPSIPNAIKKLFKLHTGRRNTIPVNSAPSFGSASNGLRNDKTKTSSSSKSMVALTGEKGYEVAWLPSENRSTIFGLTGPEMVNLPRDAVIYNHEQSKKIIKGNPNRPSLGSFANTQDRVNQSYGKRGLGKGKGKGKDNSKNPSKDLKDAAKESKKASKNSKKASKKWLSVGTIWERAIGKISVWWDNIKRGIEAAQKRFSQYTDNFSKYMDSPVATVTNAFKLVRNAAKEAAMGLKLNMRAYERATKELNELVNGKTRTTTKFVPKMKTVAKGKTGKQIAKYQKLKKKGKKRTKKENKQYKNLKKKLKKKKVIDKKGNLTKKGKSYYKKVPKRKITKTGKQILKYEKLRKKGKKRTKKENKQYKKLKSSLKKKKVLNKKGGVKASARKANIKTKGTRKKVTTADKTGKNWQTISWQKKGYKISRKKKTGKKGKTIAQKFKKFKQGGKGSAAAKAWLKKRKYINKKGDLTKKGKKFIKAKKITKDKKVKMDLSKYLKFDKDLGQWAINEKALNKITDKNQKKALKDKLNEQLDDLIQKQNEYREALQEYKNQFIDMGDQIYEKFYTWKRELDRVAVITQNIATLQSKAAVASSAMEVVYNKFLAGIGEIGKGSKDITNLKEAIQSTFNLNIQKQRQAQEQREAIQYKINESLSSTKEEKAFNAANKNYEAIKKQREALDKKYTDNQGNITIATDKKYTELLTKEQTAKRIKEERESEKRVKQGLKAIVTATKQADGTTSYNIDFSKLDALVENGNYTAEEKSAIESAAQELLNNNTDLLGTFSDEADAVNDNLGLIVEMQQTLSDLSQELVSVLEDRQQKVIDRQSKINETIKNETSKLLDGVKKSLDKRRQEEQNQKTEQDISDKQKRLAYLQSDTAGGHQVEIAQLQKEIEDSQKSYRETLEDQTINALQQQADEAAEQRERQIQILQSQLDYWKETDKFAKDVDALLKEVPKNQEYIKELLLEGKEKDQEQTKATKAVNEGEVDKAVAQLEVLPEEIAENQENIKTQATVFESDSQDFLDANGKEVVTTVDKNGEIGVATIDENGEIEGTLPKLNTTLNAKKEEVQSSTAVSTGSTLVKQATKAAQTVDKTQQDKAKAAARAAAESAEAERDRRAANIDKYNFYLKDKKNAKKITAKQINELFKLGAKIGKGKATVLSDIMSGNPFTWENTIKEVLNASGIDRFNLVKTFGSGGSMEKAVKKLGNPNTIAEIKRHQKYKNAKKLAFKTGGLADYTGPAWLDGTKTKPELVLNAQDTKNFLALKDTLSGLQNKQFTSQSNGDLNFDIDINVEKIDNDYDVKKVADAVKREIVQSAKYRNVNIVRNLK